MTKTIKDLAHYDIVGSFLRPEELKKARKDFSEGKISQDELKEIEDRLIDELVEKEKEVGLKAVTDGEFNAVVILVSIIYSGSCIQLS